MTTRSPGFKLFLAGAIGFILLVPLLMVYGLVSDRQHQARVAQEAITAGVGGPQIVSGPVLVIPYDLPVETQEIRDGQRVTRTQTQRKHLYLSPTTHRVATTLDPERKRKALYETVLYRAKMDGTARFELPQDLNAFDIDRDALILDEVQLRFGVSDPRGLRAAANVTLGGEPVSLEPGKGTRSSGGAGFHGEIDWSGGEPLDLAYAYSVRGSRTLSLVAWGGQTEWQVDSSWQHPGFAGAFLPDTTEISEEGFAARWSIGNLALGQALATDTDLKPPVVNDIRSQGRGVEADVARAATINLVEPADIYAQVDRSVKYGFLFIGFTFAAFLLFDVVGGARVAAAEYLLTGAGLVLFFVLLLAFAEWTGFVIAYAIASGAIIALLTAYSAAVLGGWKRASFIGAMLVGLYAVLYVLLSLEAASLIVGSIIMFLALAAVMYATRNVAWSEVTSESEELEG